MAIKTKMFTEDDLETALEEFELFCEQEEFDAEDIVSVNIISRHADRETTVVLTYDDSCDSD